MRSALNAISVATAVLTISSFATLAQTPVPITQGTQGIKRTILQKFDVPGTNLETIIAAVEVAPNFKAGRHTHPGNVTGIATEGEFYITLDGQPEKKLIVGESQMIPVGAIHDEGTKDKPAKFIGVYVLEKGKPMVAPIK